MTICAPAWYTVLPRNSNEVVLKPGKLPPCWWQSRWCQERIPLRRRQVWRWVEQQIGSSCWMLTLTVSFQSMMGRKRVWLASWALYLLYKTTKPQVAKLGVNAPCFEHYNPHGPTLQISRKVCAPHTLFCWIPLLCEAPQSAVATSQKRYAEHCPSQTWKNLSERVWQTFFNTSWCTTTTKDLWPSSKL